MQENKDLVIKFQSLTRENLQWHIAGSAKTLPTSMQTCDNNVTACKSNFNDSMQTMFFTLAQRVQQQFQERQVEAAASFLYLHHTARSTHMVS